MVQLAYNYFRSLVCNSVPGWWVDFGLRVAVLRRAKWIQVIEEYHFLGDSSLEGRVVRQ